MFMTILMLADQLAGLLICPVPIIILIQSFDVYSKDILS